MKSQSTRNSRPPKSPFHNVAKLIDGRLSLSITGGIEIKESEAAKLSTCEVDCALVAEAASGEATILPAQDQVISLSLDYPRVGCQVALLKTPPASHETIKGSGLKKPKSHSESKRRLHVDSRKIEAYKTSFAGFANPNSAAIAVEKMQTNSYRSNLKLPSKTRVAKTGKNQTHLKIAPSKIVVKPLKDSILAALSITRRRDAAPNEARFAVERRLLASLAGVAESDIEWVGLFRRVPIGAAQAIEIDERRGILSLTLKPDAVEIVRRSAKAVVNLAIGRNKITGAIVQTLVR